MGARARDRSQFGFGLGHAGPGKINFVYHRHDGEPLGAREVQMGQGLGLDALGGIHEEHCALDRRQRPRHLVGKVGVPRRVNQVQHIRERARIAARISTNTSRGGSC